MKQLLLVASLFIGGCLLGCAGKDLTFEQQTAQLEQRLAALKAAGFKGEVRMNIGGSPLGLNACTNWSLGPAQSTINIEGEVDFTDNRQPR